MQLHVSKNGCLLIPLSQLIDQYGVLREGGRLDKNKKNTEGDGDRHPVIMPKNHYVTNILVRRFH